MGACCGAFCRELDIRNLGLKYHDPRAFAESTAIPLPLFIVYRIIFGCVFVAALTYIGLTNPQFNIIIHFNYWCLSFIALYFVIGALVSLWHSSCTNGCKGKRYNPLVEDEDTSCALQPWQVDDSDPGDSGLNLLSWQHELLWVLHTIAIDTSLVLLVAYFSFWYKFSWSLSGLLNIPRHALPFLLLVLDIFVSGIPVRIMHVIYGNIFGAAYVVFCLVHIITSVPDLRGTPHTYPSLEFSDAPIMYTAWLSIFILGGFLVSQILFYMMFKLRESLGRPKQKN